jgi:eukaryotic-like serine/threonine-protein kinase
MRPEFKQAKDIFLAAVEKANPEERAAFLREACSGNDALRHQVDGLLRRHEDAGSFLENPPRDDGGTISFASDSSKPAPPTALQTEVIGMRIGPYKLVQQLGEGGMGTVWVAEQTEPVKRRVALKVIKPGLDSAQVIRRFEAERQALALMDHTHIAKVLDAGSTTAGRPYFVMELVKGVPITKYCDELHLPLRERLELLVPVCQAIQHAHQKGVIHRDIKPSNVLVSIQDGKPVPKVIDFGVAKALHQRLADASMYTEIGQIVGTLEYMSPEQAELSALDIDTRADVYALGVLLYELLTGTTPLDKVRLRSAAFTEMLRIIKEVEPPRPSTRLTESKKSLPSLAAQRRTEPQKLARDVRGELDWIVMRCLEKDRTRRYESASGLARDIERHLRDEPVEACPPSALYRLGKALRRNKRRVIAASLVLLALIAGMASATSGYIQVERERRRALVALNEAHLARASETQQRRVAEDQRQLAEHRRQLAETNENAALAERLISEAMQTFLKRDLLSQADATEQANASYASELASQGSALLKQKKWPDAERALRECLTIREKAQPSAWTTANTKSMLGEALAEQKNYEVALPLLLAGYNEMKDRESAIPANAKPRLHEAAQRLVRFYEATGNNEKAEEWSKKAAAFGVTAATAGTSQAAAVGIADFSRLRSQ